MKQCEMWSSVGWSEKCGCQREHVLTSRVASLRWQAQLRWLQWSVCVCVTPSKTVAQVCGWDKAHASDVLLQGHQGSSTD